MFTLRVFPDQKIQDAIISAVGEAEKRINERVSRYREVLESDALLIPTVRKIQEQMI